MSASNRKSKLITYITAILALVLTATCALGVGTIVADRDGAGTGKTYEFKAEYGIDMSDLRVWSQSSSVELLSDYTPNENISDGKIAPGVNGTSYFKMTNTNYFPVNVILRLVESSNIHLPMRYRLHKCDARGNVISTITDWEYSTIKRNAVVFSTPDILLARDNASVVVMLEWEWLYESYVCMADVGSYVFGDIISADQYRALDDSRKVYFVSNDETDTAGGVLNKDYTVTISVTAEQTI